MRLLSKVAMGASAITLAAALAAGIGVTDASAETSEISSSNISIDYENQKLDVTVGENKRIYVSFPTEKSGTLTADKNTSVYEKGENTKVSIDLSTLNVAKDNYIKIWGDKNTDPIVMKLSAGKILKKATVNNYEGNFEVTTKDGSKYDNSGLEFATINNWTDYSVSDKVNFDFDFYTELGATLRLRIGATKTATLSTDADKGTDIKDKDGNEYTFYTLKGNFASKEIKAKIAKKANAPKTKVDYVNGTITVPNNVEYRITSSSDSKLGNTLDWVATEKKLDLKLGEESSKFKEIDSKTYVVDFRTKSDSGKKKAASKYNSVNINKRDSLKITDGSKAESMAAYMSSDTDKKEAVVAAVGTVTKAAGKKVTKAAIELENKAGTAYNFQYVVKDSKTDPADGDKVKVVTSKNKVTVKLDASKGQYLYVRRISAKGSEDWTTPWIELAEYGSKTTTTEEKYKFQKPGSSD